MNWDNWWAFWSMGGYASYVWGSFGLCGAALVAENAALSARRRAIAAAPLDDGADEMAGMANYAEPVHGLPREVA